MDELVTIAPLPAPLAWDVEPAGWSLDVGPALTMAAPAGSDLFIDPSSGEQKTAAPRLLGRVEGDFQLSARVRCTFAGAFDAGALLLWASERCWVKLAHEVSPDGEPMVVSVVTDGRSDDANAFVVPDGAVWLRVSRRGAGCALHARLDGERWRFVRHFALDAPAGLRAGFLVQSPTGDGADAHFDDIAFVPEGLTDLRSGV